MATHKTTTSIGQVNLGTTLLLIFMALKLTDNIDWSWWWVLSPLWIGFAITIPLFFLLTPLKHPR